MMSCVTISLNFRGVYWTSHKVSNVLTLLQIAAKVHDLFVMFSLSQVVLYYLRHELVTPKGTCFGLIGTSYSISGGGLPFSGALWHLGRSIGSANQSFSGRGHVLLFLLLVSIGLGICANPAASILLIPDLPGGGQT